MLTVNVLDNGTDSVVDVLEGALCGFLRTMLARMNDSHKWGTCAEHKAHNYPSDVRR